MTNALQTTKSELQAITNALQTLEFLIHSFDIGELLRCRHCQITKRRNSKLLQTNYQVELLQNAGIPRWDLAPPYGFSDTSLTV